MRVVEITQLEYSKLLTTSIGLTTSFILVQRTYLKIYHMLSIIKECTKLYSSYYIYVCVCVCVTIENEISYAQLIQTTFSSKTKSKAHIPML